MISKKEIYDFHMELNNTTSVYPKEKCIHEIYEACAQECPEAIALTFNDFSMTYGELNDRANKLAHYLKSLGVVRETIVGLCIERSVEAIVSILGILKAGGAYLPLDPNYPLDRLKFMLHDTKAPFLLIQAELENKFSDIETKKISFESIEKTLLKQSCKNLCSGTASENLAYIMYTSGSTGQPKGIEITHGNVLRLVINTNYVNLNKNEILLQYAPISFDASTFEIWGALLNGGQLVICPPGDLLPEEIGQIIKNNNVTIVWLTAALFHNIVENSIESLSSVRQLLAGGDILFPESVKKVLQELKGICLINGYGPTENTTFTCCYPMTDVSQVGSSVPIGRPVSNTKVYILDKNMEPVPVGSAGELYASGDGVARGYHNRPELTQAVFIKNPFSDDPNSKLYRIGDMARYLPDGNIEFIGRADNQVKIRGYRIEPGEIEHVFLKQEIISQAVIIVREEQQKDKKLVAYYISKKKMPDLSKKLRNFLSEKLPEYMIPQYFVKMNSFPMTPNGKIDRNALPDPVRFNYDKHRFKGPETDLEEIIAEIWQEVLGIGRISIDDNFFEIGGHSLSAVNIVSKIRKTLNIDLSVADFLKAKTIRRLSNSLQVSLPLTSDKEGKIYQPELKPFPRHTNLPLSSTQLRLWFIKQLSPDSIEYNLPFAMRFQGKIDIDLLKKCLIQIIDRHESLRTTFQLEKDIPVQVMNKISGFDIPLIDFSNSDINLREKQLKAYMEDQAKQSFNLSESPILRASMIRISEDDHVLFFLTHHIIFDGISYAIFQRELFHLYKFHKKRQTPLLPHLPVQYADYAVWQQEWLHGKEYQDQSAYWMNQLKGNLPVLEIHADYQRPAVMSFCGAREELTIPETMVNSLFEVGRFKDATLFMVLFSAFNTLLYRYTNQMDICVGVPVAGRNSTEIKDLIGFFTNTLVFRTTLKPDFSFLELLEKVKNTTLDALSNQNMPFERLVEKINPKRDLSTTPLYQVMFVFLPEINRDLQLPGLSWKPEKVATHTAQTDLSIWIDKLEDGMNIAIEYNTDLFCSSNIRRMLENFEVLLKGIVADHRTSIAKLPVISDPEKEKMAEWNMTDVDFPKEACLHQLFELQAKKTPDKIAACFNDRQITYKELDEKANKVANYLIEFNVGPDIFVGICINRSLEMLIGLLGILKAGAAYLPLDPEYPDERLAYMIENAQVSVLITQNSVLENLPDNNKARIICIDTDWDKISVKSSVNPVLKKEPLPENLAYIIFTSGSTGKPKGVQVPHGAVVNFLTSMAKKPGITEDDIMLAVTTLSFDIAVLELYLPIITGAKTIIVSREVSADGIKLRKTLTDSGATIMQATPSTWRLLLAAGWEGNDRLKILCGGEAFPKDLFKELISRVKSLWNMYGPTETTVWSTCYQLKNPDEPILVGRPIANTQIHILDSDMNLVPIGVPGELYIGGDGVTRGYLGRPKLNKKQFVKNRFSNDENKKLYRTGDLVRYHEDGNIEYLNRLDYQVKIRGFRIELGEIESVISEHQHVKQSVVTIREDRPGDVRLIAHIVPFSNFSKQNVITHLRSLLPYYMMPHHFVEMKSFPLTPAGKIDRKSLPAPDTENIAKSGQFIEPNTEFEKQICEIWRDVLGIDKISIDDNFFEIGGHSLIAVTVFSKLSNKFGVNMPLATFIKAPTVQELALVVEKSREKMIECSAMEEKSEWTHLVPIQPEGSRPPLFCMHAIGGNVLNYYSFVSELGNDQPLFGLQCRGLDGLSEPFQSIETMAEYYIKEILAFQPDGPYFLCGGSMGGMIALEVAQQLKQREKKIGSLIMFDTYNSDYINSVRNKRLVFEIDFIREIFKTPPNKMIQYIRIKPFLKIKNLFKLFVCLCFRLVKHPIPYALRYFYIKQKHMKPLLQYKAKPYNGNLILFFNSTDGLNEDSAIIKGWEKYISGKIDFIGIPAKHSGFIEDPTLSSKLADCLKKIKI